MALKPKRRSYTEEADRPKVRDVDAADRAQRMHAWSWSLYAGLSVGGLLGFVVGHPIVGAFLGPVVIYAVIRMVTGTAGKGAGVLYMPSGSSTPRKAEYSRAQALEIRGEFMEAVRAYEGAILDAPDVPEPYLRIARLFRDEVKELDLAVHWFRRAQREASLSTGEAIRTHRELAEIFLHMRREPRRAAPELARLAETYPDTPDGKWAASELADVKEEMGRKARDPDSP